MEKVILGLDLGTNSIGWAITDADQKSLIDAGVRIIPMSQDIIGAYEQGNSYSQTAERTKYRGTRHLRERFLLRRQRLHRVLRELNFLPNHYCEQIDKFGNLVESDNICLQYKHESNEYQFLFMESYNEMLDLFRRSNKIDSDKKVPYDWTLFWLRKKALTRKIKKEELAWIILNFNQKRGYYQLRGEDEAENELKDKLEEFYSLKVVNVTETENKKKDETWYNIHLENGWIYKRSSKTPLNDWIGKIKDFIVTTSLDDNGIPKKDTDGNIKRSFRAPKDDDWSLQKKKTENTLNELAKNDKYFTVGTYIFDNLFTNLKQKINGKLIRTIERDYYKKELELILAEQIKHHPELNKGGNHYHKCIELLYPQNNAHRNFLVNKDFVHLFVKDIIFYQRPLKSKKSSINTCKFEKITATVKGEQTKIGVPCIAKSHPLFQEFRIWEWISNLRIFQRNAVINNKPVQDIDVTSEFINNNDDKVKLFDYLNSTNSIDQKNLLKFYKLSTKTHRWNFIDDDKKIYPCAETRTLILKKMTSIPEYKLFNTDDFIQELWHILYSVDDKIEIVSALSKFAQKNSLPESFVEHFKSTKKFEKEYGSLSLKAISKILPIMRIGKYWDEEKINKDVLDRIHKIINGEWDQNIKDRVRNNATKFNLDNVKSFQGLPLWFASYVVYDRHSETDDTKWNSPQAIIKYLTNEFKQHSLRNPIVEQIITETLKVVKDIWEYYGGSKENFFDKIQIELSRDLKNTKEERQRITKIISNNEATNLRIKSILVELANDNSISFVRPNSPHQADILKIYEEYAINNEEKYDENLNEWIYSPADEEILKISKLPNPTPSQIQRYKLWLEQRYRSPYTGRVIPLNKLFTPAYEIEHIIPKAVYLDDSLNNKVICESHINKLKVDNLAYNFIKISGTTITEHGIRIFSVEEYIKFIEDHYKFNKRKMENLLREEIPSKMIDRQLNDTRYISRRIMMMLSNIVREKDEIESVSKNVIPSSGTITSTLRNAWGLDDIWNELITPRFQRLNEITNSDLFGRINPNTNKFLPEIPLIYQKSNSKKRIDHRHHALDAIVIAFTSRNHINYLNNLHAKGTEKNEKERYEVFKGLRGSVCEYSNNKWNIINPYNTFSIDVKKCLNEIIISFKSNQRVINKTINKYTKWVNGKKVSIKQSGENWAVRKALHKETIYGKVSIKANYGKTVALNSILEHPELIIDKSIRKSIKILLKKCDFDVKKTKSELKSSPIIINGEELKKVNVYEWVEGTASRKQLDETFDSKKIKESVTDTGIQLILLAHLNKYNEQIKQETIEHPELAFSPEGIDKMNENIIELNNGKFHQPIFKVRIYESGSRFSLGIKGNKKTKFVEAEKGTNLFFVIYQNENGKRNYESVSFEDVVEHQKQVSHLSLKEKQPIPINNTKGQFLFYLSPNDLVYIPTEDEINNPNIIDINKLNNHQKDRIYKMVSCTGNQCMFLKANVAQSIVNKKEFSSSNKMERSLTGEMIKECCVKLNVSRLGKQLY